MQKATGLRGKWEAKLADGRTFPCIHEYWCDEKKQHYNDPGVDLRPIWGPFHASLSADKLAIITKDNRDANGTFERKGYIGLYQIDNVQMTKTNLTFDIVKMIERLY